MEWKMASEKEKTTIFKEVQITVQFLRIGAIDTLNEKYHAEVKITAKWRSNEYFNRYDRNKYWNPELYIENTLEDPKESIRYSIVNEGSETFVIEKRRVKGVFWERLELQNFPFDIQELGLTIASKLSNEDIKLVSNPENHTFIDSKVKDNFVEQQKWRLFKIVRMSDKPFIINSNVVHITPVTKDDTLDYPKLVASCFCARKPSYYLFNAFFLIFLITVTTFTSFSIDPKRPFNRIPTVSTFLLTSVSFKWVINRSLPAVSYLTSLDKYSMVCIFYICLLASWHAIIGSNWSEEQAREIDKWMLVAFACIFLIINIAFAIWFLIAYRKIKIFKKREREFLNELESLNKQDSQKKL